MTNPVFLRIARRKAVRMINHGVFTKSNRSAL